jgi:hypothetical protein
MADLGLGTAHIDTKKTLIDKTLIKRGSGYKAGIQKTKTRTVYKLYY